MSLVDECGWVSLDSIMKILTSRESESKVKTQCSFMVLDEKGSIVPQNVP